ncbi:hypothetical protein [Spirilliplanes yamanashiensis]|uniref:Uncharacterized protein n=1 Tax=Spirilliplanes yamanashiensis TaxID=42233 RepID=A0A8J3YB84_9ACTN|nr:hypothetical protein [Spirilliplanes yamanashiensis]MDP9819056.1 hypothetical protein [Spirilliplanes yamanashiensis]GIJ05511.1 hypothetical protein Sya03_48630 [Spirilliplanes yamanashiensis]
MLFPVTVSSAELEPDGVADLARLLRAELLETDADDVRFVTEGPVPEGVKAAEALAIGAMLVAAAPEVLPAVIDTILSWLKRQPRDVEVEIDGDRFRGPVTRAQRDQLVAAFLDRAAARPDDRDDPA